MYIVHGGHPSCFRVALLVDDRCSPRHVGPDRQRGGRASGRFEPAVDAPSASAQACLKLKSDDVSAATVTPFSRMVSLGSMVISAPALVWLIELCSCW